jgi:hypothetical protein
VESFLLSDMRPLALVRQLSARFLQYPRSHAPRTEVLTENTTFFWPHPSPHEPLPVIGAAVMLTDEDADPYKVVLFTTSQIELTTAFRKRFDPFGTIVSTHETGIFRLAAPAGGDSIGYGTALGPSGTLGCILVDVANDEYALSGNHVIADENKGTIGVDEVWSPGSANGGTALNRIGLLHDFETVLTTGGRTNVMDAAVARLDVNGGRPFTIPSVGEPKGVDPHPPYNVQVQKYGDATRHTTGDLTFKSMSLLIDFDGGQALFVDQYGIVGDHHAPFAGGGDSGALVANTNDEAVGLLMAIAGTGEIAVANPIQPILTRFGLSF